MAETWSIQLKQLEVRNADEDGALSDGDEPYFVTIGFRSTFKKPGSTKVFWSEHLDDDWANGIDGGQSRGIPAAMGLVSFDNVVRQSKADLVAGGMPEVVGAIVVSFESDATPFGAIRDKMRDLEGEVSKHLVDLIEKGNLNLANPAADIKAAVQQIKDSMTPSVGEAISLWLQSWSDPDDLIGVAPVVFVAVEPGIVAGIPALQSQPIDLTFKADGVDYHVTGAVSATGSTSSALTAAGHLFVNVVSRSQDHLDVFMTTADGVVRTAAWEPAFKDGWHGWWELHGGRAAAGAAVSATSRSADKLDAFVVGTDGEIWTAAWEPAFKDGWHGWWNVKHGATVAGAPVTAVSRSADHLDVFVVGNDGHVYTAAWEPAFKDGWHGWWRVGTVKAPPGSYVGAAVRSADHLDIFVTDVNGNVMTAAWEPAFKDGWHGWWPVKAGKAAPGAPVTAVSRSADHLDVFVVGTDGHVWTAAWEPAFKDGWHGWWRVRDAVVPAGAYVGAAVRSTDHLDIFVTDVNGNVLTAAWEPAFKDGWHGWWPVKAGKAEPGAPVTAVSRRKDNLDVFVVGTDGKPYTAAWEPAFKDGWHGWWRIGH